MTGDGIRGSQGGAGTTHVPDSARGYEAFRGVVGEVSSRSVPHWEPERGAPSGSPNIVLMVLDDLGYSDTSPYGSEIDTPRIAQLAAEGYLLTDYHTPPVCSPARAAILTGLNPHRAGYASVAHRDPGYPAYRMQLRDDTPTVAESFRASGYATFMVGKWHLTKEALLHDGADRGSWPLQRGFDRYYGGMEGFTSLFQPHRIVRDNSAVPEPDPEAYLTDTLTDEAIGMLSALRANDSSRPFFLYFAHHAVHGPLQAKTEDIAKYRGQYDSGWDHIRSERFRRQVRDGLFAAGVRAAPRNVEPEDDVVPWDELTSAQKRTFARYMEVYAAAVDSVDQNLGRLIDHLKATGDYENTIFLFTSDNGGTGEGGAEGTRQYLRTFFRHPMLQDVAEPTEDDDLDLIGGPRSSVHYPRGWGYASNTPFRLYKGHTMAGGVRAPLLVSWPAGLPRAAGDDGMRRGLMFASDVAPTLLDLAGVPPLRERAGVAAADVDGMAMTGMLRDPESADHRKQQYFEFAGHRGLISGRWKIVTEHRRGAPFGDSEWQLFDLLADPAETDDLAAQHPELVTALAAEWNDEAWQNTVFPLDDDGSLTRVRPSTELKLEQPVLLLPGTPTLERFRSRKLTYLRDFAIAVDLDHAPGDEGVLVAHGDQGGGYHVRIAEDQVQVVLNAYGAMHRCELPLSRHGRIQVDVRFQVRPGLRWDIELSVEGAGAARLANVPQLVGMAPFTGISVGADRGSPVDWDLFSAHGPAPYSGVLHGVRYCPGPKAQENPEIIRTVEEHAERVAD